MTEFQAQPALVAEVDLVLRDWSQGDVVIGAKFIHAVSESRQLTAAADCIAHDETLGLVVTEPDGLVLLTQTCDIRRSCLQRPYLDLAPVIRLSGEELTWARKRSMPRYAPIPGLADDAFADLDRIMTAEKSLLLDAERVQGCSNDQEARILGDAIGRKHSRFAFPDDLPITLKGLVNRLKKKADKSTLEGQAIRAIEEIRVSAHPSWFDEQVDVFIAFLTGSAEEARDVMTLENWEQQVDKWLALCSPHGSIGSVEAAMIAMEDFTAREYVDSDRLDLDHISP